MQQHKDVRWKVQINIININSEQKCFHSRLETVHGRRFENGAWQPVPCRRTCDDKCTSAELQGCREQMTEFRLQHSNLHRAQTNMQGPVHASLCTSSDTIWTGCALLQVANARIKPVTCKCFPAWICRCYFMVPLLVLASELTFMEHSKKLSNLTHQKPTI